MVFCCSLSTFSPVAYTEEISCSSFAARCLLYAAPFVLLVTCYSQLSLRCLLPDYYLVLASLWLDLFFLVARPSPFTARWLNAYYMLVSITCWQLTAHFSIFFSVFDSSIDKSPRAPCGSFRAVYCASLTSPNSLILIAH